METQFRHAFRKSAAVLTLAVASGALTASTAAGQSVIVQDPIESRTIIRERAPLDLTPTQRTTIYRTIVPQGFGRQPIVRERVVTEPAYRERVVTEPAYRERVITEPAYRERVVPAPFGERVVTTDVDYVVGDRVPATVVLRPFPERVVRQVPAMRDYRYMVVNDRLLMVDPATSTVVEEIVRD